MLTSQVQVKLSLSPQLSSLLKVKATNLGIPVTQFVKHLIINDLEKDNFPTFKASDRVELKAGKAIKEISKAKSVKNIPEYFKTL